MSPKGKRNDDGDTENVNRNRKRKNLENSGKTGKSRTTIMIMMRLLIPSTRLQASVLTRGRKMRGKSKGYKYKLFDKDVGKACELS